MTKIDISQVHSQNKFRELDVFFSNHDDLIAPIKVQASLGKKVFSSPSVSSIHDTTLIPVETLSVIKELMTKKEIALVFYSILQYWPDFPHSAFN